MIRQHMMPITRRASYCSIITTPMERRRKQFRQSCSRRCYRSCSARSEHVLGRFYSLLPVWAGGCIYWYPLGAMRESLTHLPLVELPIHTAGAGTLSTFLAHTALDIGPIFRSFVPVGREAGREVVFMSVPPPIVSCSIHIAHISATTRVGLP